MRRPLHRWSAAAAAVLTLPTASMAFAPSATAAPPACWSEAPTDLDGGGPDLAIGYPSYDLPGATDAGAIVLFSDVATAGSSTPRSPRRTTVLTAASFGSPVESGALFGAAVVSVPDDAFHSDADDCADLLVSAPGATVGGSPGAGRVYLLAGAAGGMDPTVSATFDATSLSNAGPAQSDAGFGTALAVSGGVIAIGEPRRDLAGARDAGRVVRVDFQTAGGEDPIVTSLTQSSAEADDRFGEVLDAFPTGLGALILVGVPREDVGGHADAGAVTLIAPDDTVTSVTQNSPGAAGAAEGGDRFGASLDAFATFTTHPVVRIAIGAPGEDLGDRRDAGMVSWAVVDLFDSPGGVSPIRGTAAALTQNSPGVPGAAEASDRFGAAVTTGEYGSDGGRRHLVVGARTENIGSLVDAGMVSLTRVTEAGAAMPGPTLAWTQDESGTPGAAERGDRLGSSLASHDLTRIIDDDHVTWQVVVTTVPGEDIGAVADAGSAYVGVPGAPAVRLLAPFVQRGAGIGMAPMRGW